MAEVLIYIDSSYELMTTAEQLHAIDDKVSLHNLRTTDLYHSVY